MGARSESVSFFPDFFCVLLVYASLRCPSVPEYLTARSSTAKIQESFSGNIGRCGADPWSCVLFVCDRAGANRMTLKDPKIFLRKYFK